MRKNLHLVFTLILMLCASNLLQAQTRAYKVSGYAFHPSAPRQLNIIKSLTKVGPATYVADLADLGGAGYQFQFQVDSSNHLVNWKPIGATPVVSGFMTEDNPGNLDYSLDSPYAPGKGEYVSTTYNNTYNPATRTFYMHYGYNAAVATGTQNDYTRQFYERWADSVVAIDTFKPAIATSHDTVTIYGNNFTGTTKVLFGAAPAGSFSVLSDSVITAIVLSGTPDTIVSVTVVAPFGTATKNGFVFCKSLAQPVVTISASPGDIVCPKTPVTFTAKYSFEGNAPTITWRKNGKKAGANSTTYIDNQVNNHDSVYAIITVSSKCVTANTDTSNIIRLTVNPVVTPVITIKSNAGTVICSGTPVTFTATKAAHDDSVSFVWRKNGKKVGANSATYIDNKLADGDSVWAVLTSHTPCATETAVHSNVLAFTVNANIKKQVTITANTGNTVCAGTKVTFAAATVNAGGNINYNWKKNGAHVGKNTHTYIDTLANGDKITCSVTGDAACSVPDTATSNTLAFVVLHKPAAPAAITGKDAVKANQAGLTYSTLKVNGVTYAWAVPSTATITAGQGTHSITVKWGNKAGTISVKAVNDCGNSPTVTKTVTIAPGLIAGATEENSSSSSSLKKELLYPNPATADAKLTLSGYDGKVIITITDMAGKLLWKTEKQNSGTYQLPMGKFAAGMYLVTVKDAATVKTFKLLKAK